MAPPFPTYEVYRLKRAEDFRVGVIGLLIGLAVIAWLLVSAPDAVSEYVRVEVVPSDVSIVQERRRLRGLRITAADGQRYQAENIYVVNSGYTADELLAGLRIGEPVTLWVLHPDAETPKIRGIESAQISAGPETGVAASSADRRFGWILGLGFAGLGAFSVALGFSRRPPAAADPSA